MIEELKACPKCGIVGKVVSDDPDCGYRKAYMVECDCGEWFGTEAEAIAAWNRRTPDWQHDEAEAITFGRQSLLAGGDTIMSSKLECPFCGGTDVLQERDGVHCEDCGGSAPALAAWNLRTPDWRALAQELATALGKFVGYTLSGDVYYFSPETHDLLARARKAGLEV